MDGLERQDRKREARRRLSAQRNRAGRLRGRVVVASLICFMLLWGVVFAQMATGNDPVLGDKSTAAAQPESQPVEAEATTAVEAEPEIVEPETEVVETEPEVELEPVTTGQS